MLETRETIEVQWAADCGLVKRLIGAYGFDLLCAYIRMASSLQHAISRIHAMWGAEETSFLRSFAHQHWARVRQAQVTR